MTAVLATIPYWTAPIFEIGPLTLRTFGMMVAVGVLCGIWYAAAHAEQYGMTRDETYQLGVRMVIAGVIGARLTWVLTHMDQIETPIDVIAVWEGGLQFSGGFIAAIAVGLPTFLRWSRLQRWQLLDGFAVAVLIGGAFGRLGCLAVGEHFGRASDAPWATTFKGAIGPVAIGQELREPTLGPDGPVITVGTSFLNPALYECVSLFLLFGVLAWLLRRRPTPGLVSGLFLIGYGIQRFTWDSLRVNDERVAGLTGAQWMCLAMVPIGIYVLTVVRPFCARALVEAAAEDEADAATSEPDVPDAGGAAADDAERDGSEADDDADGGAPAAGTEPDPAEPDPAER